MRRAFNAMREKGLSTGDFSDLLSINQSCMSSNIAVKIFWEQSGSKEEVLQAGLSALSLPLSEDMKIEPTPGTIKLLKDLKGIDLCVVTRGNPALQISKLEKAGIQPKQFSKIVVGKGLNKKFTYQKVLEEFRPSKCIVCGDRVPIDLTPAKQLGLTTVHLRNGRGCFFDKPREDVDVSIKKIEEIKNVL